MDLASVDKLLTMTRFVRKRLDLTRRVAREMHGVFYAGDSLSAKRALERFRNK